MVGGANLADPSQAWAELTETVLRIVTDATALKNKHTDQSVAPVNYSAVFCRDLAEYAKFVFAVEQNGHLAQDTATGPTFVVPPIETAGGQLRLVKIRRPDPTRTERGDADFAVSDYDAFKRAYLSRSGFKLIERQDFEMIELVDKQFDVRAYFSNPPVESQAYVRAALKQWSM